GGNIGRPAVAVTSKGVLVAWTDDHEQPGHDHVYSVLVDPTGRPTSAARDLTPEADYAMRPELLAVDDRVVLLFWDKSGRAPDGSGFWVGWQASPDKDGDDVFLRHLDPELLPRGPEVRATDYAPDKTS